MGLMCEDILGALADALTVLILAMLVLITFPWGIIGYLLLTRKR